MGKLHFEREWIVGEQIGGGGFGRVYAATSGDQEAVVKLVPKAPGAEREMLFADLVDVRNVVPIIDSGETEESWALVMPRAEKSLRQHLTDAQQALPVDEVITVLSDIVAALADLDGLVVHRDLKPENILLLSGRWCLADFGISRYAEATTAPDTRKFALSPPYAAPERWRNERATSATDVYSLGIIIYELLSRTRPFRGPRIEDYREQHLHDDVPPLSDVPEAIEALMQACLFKAPGARPTPESLAIRLKRMASEPAASGAARLQAANRTEAARRGRQARDESEHGTEIERKNALGDSADSSLKQISDGLRDEILRAASLAETSTDEHGGWTVSLGKATLQFYWPRYVDANPFSFGKDTTGLVFDVVSNAALGVYISPGRYGWSGFTHSLWYCDAQTAGEFQWFETAFEAMPHHTNKRWRGDPFALPPNWATSALSERVSNDYQVAWPFTAVANDLGGFIERWAGWFADAIQGQLTRSGTMPKRRSEGSWRRS